MADEENAVSHKRKLHRRALRDNRKQQKVDEILLRTERLCRVSHDSGSEPSGGKQGGDEDEGESDGVTAEYEGVNEVQDHFVLEEGNGDNVAVCVGADGIGEEEIGSVVEDETESSANDDLANSVSSNSDIQGDNANAGQVAFRDEEEKQQYVIDSIREWALESGHLSMSKLDNLLHRLRPVYPLMPLSYKNLFSTNYDFDIRILDSGGLLWYKGVEKSLHELDLRNYLLNYNKITIDINMDGIPISKSPPKKFFPTLGFLVGTCNDPFIISIFYGAKDPNIDEYLSPYVEEVEQLSARGLEFEGKRYQVVIRNYILDAVAREQIKCIKAHSGYNACEKCIVEGEWIANRLTFVDLDAPLRTDLSFRLKEHPEHHRGTSPLERIGTGMVSQFRLDGMHLLYGGVVKRLIEFWLFVPGPWKLYHEVVAIISEVFLFLKNSCPLDFNRKPNSLTFFKTFKCTEFRRIILYDGIVAFKDIIDDNIYKHFLLLHCAVVIMCSPIFVHSKLELAKQLLKTFITHSVNIYGAMFVVYNVHSLSHLPSECAEHGVIDNFSAFKFENKLKTIKQSLKSGYKQLQQAARRDKDKSSSGPLPVILESEPSHCVLSGKHLIPDEIVQGEQYKKIKIGNVTFGLGIKNSCFKTNTGDVVLLKNIVRSGRRVCFVGQRFLMYEDFYDYPIPSSDLGIQSVSRLDERRRVYRLKDVLAKCWLMPNSDYFFVILKFLPSEDDPKEYIDCGLRKWLKGEPDDEMICDTFWPPNNADRAIKLQQSHCENWKTSAVQVLRFYDTYIRARAAVPKFCDDSHYETEAPSDMGKFKRKKFRRIVQSSSSDSEERPSKISKKTIPPPPPISQVASNQGAAKDKKKPSTIRSGKGKTSQKRGPVFNVANKTPDDKVVMAVDAAKAAAHVKMNLNIAGSPEISGITLLKKSVPRQSSPEENSNLSLSNETKFSRPRLVNEESVNNALRNTINERLKAGRAAADAQMNLSPNVSVRTGGMTSPWRVTPLRDRSNSSDQISIFSPIQNQSPKKKSQYLDEIDDDILADEPEEINIAESPEKSNPPVSPSGDGDCIGQQVTKSHSPPLSSKHSKPLKPLCQEKSSSQTTFDIAALAKNMEQISKMVNNNNIGIQKLHDKMDVFLVNNGKLLRRLVPHEKLHPPANMPSLPVKTLEEFNALEKFLAHTPNEIALIDYFSNFVLKDDVDAETKSVRQILQNMLHNSVAELFNLDGGNKKKSFRKANIYKVFQGCLVSAFKDVNLQKLDNAAQAWLKDAPWRKGGSKCSK